MSLSWVDVVYNVIRKQSPVYTIIYVLSIPWIIVLTISKFKKTELVLSVWDSHGNRVFLDREGHRVECVW
jgi:hypothetical protein